MNITPIICRNADTNLTSYDQHHAEKVAAFHKSFPMYQPTPLRSLQNLAARIGLRGLYVKDESYRFGLNAFKVLGSSYAIGRYLAARLSMDISDLTFDTLISEEIRSKLGEMTFVTATDGNHGRGVAWTANQLHQSSVVYMPRGTKAERLANIQRENSNASITSMSYDETVRFARDQAAAHGWITVQDTSWPGYEEIPRWIMQGYLTMAYEIYQQLDGVQPTHIFIQAGVGSMAGTVAAFFANVYGVDRPKVIVVEPHDADCIYQTALAADGKLHASKGKLETMMAGLACGEPCKLAWDILENCADFALTCGDELTVLGMRTLANPINDDQRIISGESGAVTTGVVIDLMSRADRVDILRTIDLNENSIVLCVSTEGATDRENYQRIVANNIDF